MSTATAVPITAGLKSKRIRTGLIVRLVIAAILLAIAIIDGAAIATRATAGTTEHYTVVLRPGVDAAAIAAVEANAKGFSVESVVTNADINAFTASIPQGRASALLSNPDVMYIEMDNTIDNSRSWWEDLTTKFGSLTPHFN